MASRFVNLNLKPIRRFRKALRAEIDGHGGADDLLTTWGRRYLAFLREKFRVNRSGGGSWPPLKETTTKHAKGRIGILYLTGAIFNALRQGMPGNMFRKIGFGIRVGVGGPAKHPGTDLTIAQLAMIHNDGAGNVPKRQIIYRPDRALYNLLRRDTGRVMRRLAREADKAK
jgi:hypothetical protein